MTAISQDLARRGAAGVAGSLSTVPPRTAISAWYGRRGSLILDACAVSVAFAFNAGGLRWSFVDLILPIILVRIGLGQLIGNPIRLNRGLLAFAIAFIGVAALSLLVASAADGHVNNGLAVSHLMRYALVLALALGVTSVASATPLDDLFRALRIWSVTASVFGVGVGLWLIGVPTFVAAWPGRSVGTFGDPNFFAAYLMTSLAALLVANGYRTIRTLPLQFIAISVGIIGTGSRSAIVGLAIMLAFLVLITPSTAQRLLALLVATAGAGVLLYSYQVWSQGGEVLPVLETLFMRSGATATDPRMQLWQHGLQIWQSRPLFGVGAGQAATTTQYVHQLSSGLGFRPHSVYIATLAETGLAGMLVVLAGLVGMLTRIIQTMRSAPKIGAPLLLGFVMIAQQMSTLDLQNMRYVWVFFGIALGIAAQLRVRKSSDNGARPEHDLPSVAWRRKGFVGPARSRQLCQCPVPRSCTSGRVEISAMGQSAPRAHSLCVVQAGRTEPAPKVEMSATRT